MANETTGFGIRVSITPTSGTPVTFKETEVTAVGYTGDDKIEQTTNDNTAFRSFEPGDLIEKTSLSGTAGYSSSDTANIKAALNVKGVIVTTFKSGKTITDNGWLSSWNMTTGSRGNMPLCNFTVEFEGEDASGTDNAVMADPA